MKNAVHGLQLERKVIFIANSAHVFFAVAARHCRGRLVSSLEGGYNLSALGRSVVAHLRVLARL